MTKPTPLPLATKIAVAVLLVIPCAALAAVPLYSRETPELWGWPFFYWFQLSWVLITPVLTYLAYVLLERARGRR
ncbi:MAG: hypothetical protein QOI15_2856 [Pseudonocardiales bacterium]|nr:hypothetical protein [Pseudonocardiales bacterium]MDT4921954.1 hypothetical protein [Pseudonocardiales bacterium]